MATDLKTLYPAMDDATANALAWGGLYTTPSGIQFKATDPITYSFYLNLNGQYLQGTAGTKPCVNSTGPPSQIVVRR